MSLLTRIVALCVATILFVGMAVVSAELHQQASAPELVIERFKFARDGLHVLLPIQVNGKRYSFAMDSGASTTVYDTTLRPFLGDPIRSAKMRTPGGNMTVTFFLSPAARLGHIDLPTNSQVVCMDLGKLCEASGEDIYGFLGMDFLKSRIFRIDFDSGEITFLRSVGPKPGKRVPVTLQHHVPYVLVEIPGLLAQERFQVDTGFGGYGSGDLRSEVFDALAKRGKLTYAGEGCTEWVSGSRGGRLGRVESISLENYRHEKLLFGESRTSFLGLKYWSRYVVTFDFSNRAIYLKRGHQFDRPDVHDKRNRKGDSVKPKSGQCEKEK